MMPNKPLADLFICHLGHGYSISDKNRPEEHNDYCRIAHIRYDRTISWYKKDIHPDDVAHIKDIAKTDTGTINENTPILKPI